MTLVELCAGTAALSLWTMGRAAPLTGFMGSKRRWAPEIAHLLGVTEPPARVVLVDAGPWGDVWSVLRDPSARADVAGRLDKWDGDVAADRTRLVTDLWIRLASMPPDPDPVRRVTQYLWLQARSAGTIPVWWSGARWESPSGSRAGTSARAPRNGDDPLSRTRGACGEGSAYPASTGSRKAGAAHQKAATGVEGAHPRGVGRQKSPGGRGVMSPATIARRIRDLDRIDWSRVEVVHGRVEDVAPIPGAVVYIDPPYQGAPRYAEMWDRDSVLATARRWADAGCRVAVSEAEPLPLEGWTSSPLPNSRREWVTCSWGGRIPSQGDLFRSERDEP